MMNVRSISMLATVAVVALASGCQRDDTDRQEAAVDSTLGRDLVLAQNEQQPAKLNDVPVATPPRTTPRPPRQPQRDPVPAATPPATPPRTVEPEIIPIPTTLPREGVIPAGTTALVSVGGRVCTSAKVGDKVVTQLTQSMEGSNGVSIPAGATVVLEVVSASPMTDSSKGNIAFRVNSIETNGRGYTVAATGRPDSALVRTRTTETKDDAKKVAAGAIVGGILGQIIGKDTKGTVIGAAAGAAAGTAVAIATASHEGCITDKGLVRITLNDRIVIPIAQ